MTESSGRRKLARVIFNRILEVRSFENQGLTGFGVMFKKVKAPFQELMIIVSVEEILACLIPKDDPFLLGYNLWFDTIRQLGFELEDIKIKSRNVQLYTASLVLKKKDAPPIIIECGLGNAVTLAILHGDISVSVPNELLGKAIISCCLPDFTITPKSDFDWSDVNVLTNLMNFAADKGEFILAAKIRDLIRLISGKPSDEANKFQAELLSQFGLEVSRLLASFKESRVGK